MGIGLDVAEPLGVRAEPGRDDEFTGGGPLDDLEDDESGVPAVIAAVLGQQPVAGRR